jgi:hypothetical protein
MAGRPGGPARWCWNSRTCKPAMLGQGLHGRILRAVERFRPAPDRAARDDLPRLRQKLLHATPAIHRSGFLLENKVLRRRSLRVPRPRRRLHGIRPMGRRPRRRLDFPRALRVHSRYLPGKPDGIQLAGKTSHLHPTPAPPHLRRSRLRRALCRSHQTGRGSKVGALTAASKPPARPHGFPPPSLASKATSRCSPTPSPATPHHLRCAPPHGCAFAAPDSRCRPR